MVQHLLTVCEHASFNLGIVINLQLEFFRTKFVAGGRVLFDVEIIIIIVIEFAQFLLLNTTRARIYASHFNYTIFFITLYFLLDFISFLIFSGNALPKGFAEFLTLFT